MVRRAIACRLGELALSMIDTYEERQKQLALAAAASAPTTTTTNSASSNINGSKLKTSSSPRVLKRVRRQRHSRRSDGPSNKARTGLPDEAGEVGTYQSAKDGNYYRILDSKQNDKENFVIRPEC
ncbi:unnamed protein product [Protopolystoma xenopodis]|uniref:Uncharacterized protein n=1 Tax=Protopolystoma xenopodis TaxID=117903 RepID=A0A3S4ZPJ4_9PLAT|nr:unnamed protein product [Protopolystoma xenopodis]